jgi:putative transposase
MILTYKYRIKDKSARKALSRHAYAVNQVFNWCVAAQRDVEDRYRAGAPMRKWPSHFDLVNQCKGVGAEIGIHQQTVQDVCRQFTQSRDQHRRCPRFRSSFGQRRALGWIPFQRQSRQVDGNSIVYLGKRYRFWECRRPLPKMAKGGAFVEDARGRWYVTFQVEIAEPRHEKTGAIGIDLGLKSLAVTSAGEIIGNPHHLARYAQQLAVAQRAGNKRRATAIHARIANSRKDFHHKVSTRLTRDYAFIAVGNVNANNLAKTRMAKSVLDAGWSAFRNMLRYKAQTFLEVDERFTTQTCSSCGTLPLERPKGIAGLGMREWECSNCGASHDRDVNAARNIIALARGAPRLVEESRRIAA